MIREKNDHHATRDKTRHQRRAHADISDKMHQEESIQEKVDQQGVTWRKLYVGGGAHFRNWLSQCIEIYGEENIAVEDIDSTGFRCFEESDEKMHRIWVKERGDAEG